MREDSVVIPILHLVLSPFPPRDNFLNCVCASMSVCRELVQINSLLLPCDSLRVPKNELFGLSSSLLPSRTKESLHPHCFLHIWFSLVHQTSRSAVATPTSPHLHKAGTELSPSSGYTVSTVNSLNYLEGHSQNSIPLSPLICRLEEKL